MKKLSNIFVHRFKNFPLSLSVKITAISVIVFYIMMALVVLSQYIFMRIDTEYWFRTLSQIYHDSLLRNSVLEWDPSFDEKTIFSSFDESGNRLSQVIIIEKNTQKVVVNELFYLEGNTIQNLLRLPEKQTEHLEFSDQVHYYVRRFDIGKYAVFYSGPFIDIWEYYRDLIVRNWIMLLLSVLGFATVSAYLTKMVIRPIQKYNESLESYNHNLAHEMKTPLSVIASNLDMFELTKNKKFIDSSREELIHMEKMTDALLFLSKVHHAKKDFELVDITEICTNFFSYIDEKKSMKIHIESPEEPIFENIDISLFLILLQNIYENAQKYASKPELFVQIEAEGMRCTNPVKKTLTDEEIYKIREIFYQWDTSRSSSGYGIGMSLIEKISTIFWWKLRISSQQKKFEIMLEFPR